jgi:hypothetical protein
MYTFHQCYDLLNDYQQKAFTEEFCKNKQEFLLTSKFYNKEFSSFRDFLSEAFLWTETEQGYDYWNILAKTASINQTIKQESVKKVTILAELTCLNKLVNGKVVVVDRKTNTYTTYNKGMYTPDMPETFNPEDYALLETAHCPVVVKATPKMKEQYLVNKLFTEQFGIKININESSAPVKKNHIEVEGVTYSIYDDSYDDRGLPF